MRAATTRRATCFRGEDTDEIIIKDKERSMETDKENGQAHVPKPPTREEVEEISRAQAMITDDWTGDSGVSNGASRGGSGDRAPDTASDAGAGSSDSGGDSGE